MLRHSVFHAWLRSLGLVAVCCLLAAEARANVVRGKEMPARQPDGSTIRVRVWGDEFYAVVESLDGFTLIRDPDSKLICYARLSADGESLQSTGIAAQDSAPADLGVTPHIRINPEAAAAKARARRVDFERRRWEGPLAPPHRRAQRSPARSSEVKGLCLIIDFSDDVGTIPAATVANYCNQVGYTGSGNNGSVRDYFYDVSDGDLTYTNYVPSTYYRALHPKGYYTDETVAQGVRARELIIEALTYLNTQGLDFTQFDSDGDNVLDALNCFYAGEIWNNWAEGLWPHSWTVDFCADGICTENYQMTNMSTALLLGTFCHENGHMLMDWPDLYDYSYTSAGVGRFCLMCYAESETNPCEPCAYLKYVSGWTNTTVLTAAQSGLSLPVSSSNTIYKVAHPARASEYFLIENRQRTGRDAAIPDSGLALWHIDTRGDNVYPWWYFPGHYLVTLVQADGQWHMERNQNNGDSNDLWCAPTYPQCTPQTSPNSNWWYNEASGLSFNAISTSSATMTFNFSPGADCDGDGAPDYQEILACDGSPGCGDCNGNHLPDSCDLASGAETDCNGNGLPDSCELDAAYRGDDGEAETSYCNSFDDPRTIWLNAFKVQAGGEHIDQIAIAWGDVLVGMPTTLALWRDPTNDYDPHDAQLLWQSTTPTLVKNPWTDIFTTVSIPAVEVGAAGDVFFVGAYMNHAASPPCDEYTYENCYFPAAMDFSASVGHAWICGGSNLQNLAANPDLVSVDDINGGGIWMLRAGAAPNDCNDNNEPDDCDINSGTSHDLNGNGVPDDCESDCNGNGVPDDLDLSSGTSADCNGDDIPDECQNVGPKITSQPKAVSVCVGLPAEIHVVATGVGALSYQWRKDGVPLDNASTDTLSFAAVAVTDDGVYTVALTDSCGTVVSNDAVLTVQRPIIDAHPQDQSVPAGGRVEFTVVVSGGTSFTYEWRKDGTPIFGANLPTYALSYVTPAHAGEYDVVISGCGAAQSATATLTVVLAAPEAPTPPDGAEDVSIDQMLTWNPVVAATAYDVWVDTGAGLKLLGQTPVTNWGLEDLAYSTTYAWKVVARADGLAAEGPIWTFTTMPKPPDPPAAPSQPDPPDGATNVSSDVELSWSKCAGTEFYKVLLGVDAKLADARMEASLLTTSFALADLEPGTTYRWRIIAKNVAGATPGPIWTFATKPAETTPVVTDNCPDDPDKTEPGTCGCGTPDVDSDDDGVLDCADNCPEIANADQADTDTNGVGDVCDESDDDQSGQITPSTFGCPTASTALLGLSVAGLFWTRGSGARGRGRRATRG